MVVEIFHGRSNAHGVRVRFLELDGVLRAFNFNFDLVVVLPVIRVHDDITVTVVLGLLSVRLHPPKSIRRVGPDKLQ